MVLTDPPYGMNNNTDSSRFSGGTLGHIAKRGNGGKFKGKIIGDDKPFEPSPFCDLQTASTQFEKIIIWGYNHFANKLPTGTVLIWLKRLDEAFGTFLSDAEIAWMNSGNGIYCFRDLSLMADTRNRSHPNQKPISLMKWCIKKSKTEGIVFDPFMGSGSTLVAAKQLGRKFIGIEISEKYCAIAVQRLSQEVMKL